MNDDDLLDYQLGQMDESRRERFEQELPSNPALETRSARLALALHNLLDDDASLEPPPGLADRTINRVAQHRQRPRLLDFVPTRVPFRWADVAVAAGIFLAGLATLLPAIQRSRSQLQESACAFNLQKIGMALSSYATSHQTYPHTPAGYPAGYYGIALQDQKLLNDCSVLTCPGRGQEARIKCLPPRDRFDTLMERSPDACQQMLGEEYAYHAGYRHNAGDYGPVPAKIANQAPIPLLADLPPHDDFLRVLPEGNSPDHGGGGQNVLFNDMSVRWLRSRAFLNDTDIYLNGDLKVGVGVDQDDISLIPAGFRVNH